MLFRDKYEASYKQPIGHQYAVCLKTNQVPIGYVHISAEDNHDLGYGLRREFWHSGIITEAVKAIIEEVKKSDYKYITATHDIHNPRSGEVMKRLGFKFFYSYVEQWQPKNRLVTFKMYQLNLDEQNECIYTGYWEKYKIEELTEALRPVTSVIRKCEKPQIKYKQGTTHYKRFYNIIKVMYIAKSFIEDEISQRG